MLSYATAIYIKIICNMRIIAHTLWKVFL